MLRMDAQSCVDPRGRLRVTFCCADEKGVTTRRGTPPPQQKKDKLQAMTPVTWLTGFPGPQNSAALTRRLSPRSEQDYPLPQKYSNCSTAILGINPAAFCSCSCTILWSTVVDVP